MRLSLDATNLMLDEVVGRRPSPGDQKTDLKLFAGELWKDAGAWWPDEIESRLKSLDSRRMWVASELAKLEGRPLKKMPFPRTVPEMGTAIHELSVEVRAVRDAHRAQRK